MYKKANIKELAQDLKTLSDDIVNKISCTSNEATCSIDDIWCSFKEGIHKAMDTHVPSKMASKKQQKPWITPGIKRKLREKQRAYNKARKTKLPEDWENFRKHRKHVQKETRKSYWEYVRSTCLEFQKQFWCFINKMKKEDTGISALRCTDGSLVSENTLKAEALNAQFSSCLHQRETS